MRPPATRWRIWPTSPGASGRTIAASITPTCSPASMPSAPSRRRCTSVTAAGKGQHIDVSMLESMLSLTLNELQWSQFEVKPTQRPMFGPIETSDGYVMVAIASEKTFQSLMQVIGHPEWVSDPRFAKYADRRENWASLMDGVEAWSRTVTTEKCLAELNDARRSLFGLSHRRRGVERSADRPSRRAGRGRGWRRHVQGPQPAVPHVRRQGLGGKADVDPRRAHACLSEGDRPVGG